MAENKDNNLPFSIKGLNFEKIAGYIATGIGFLLGYYLGFVFVLVFLIPIILGIVIPDWYMKRSKINHKLIKWISWANIIVWLLPFLGIFTGFCAIRFSYYFSDQKIKYRVLGAVGITLSVVNGTLGIMMQHGYF